MEKQKKLMILGSGELQAGLIEAATDLNYLIVLCGNKNKLSRSFENLIFYSVDFCDFEAVLSIAKKEKIDGIISNSEFAMRTVAYVAEKLNLPSSPLVGVKKLNEKAGFRKLQHELGVFAPEYVLTRSFEEAVKAVKKLKFPIVLKPNYCSGSRGTVIIDTYDSFLYSKDAWLVCYNYSLDKTVCIEEYVEMECLDGYVEQDIFVLGDRIIWDGIDTCMRSTKLKKVAMTDVFPIIANDEQLSCIKTEIEKLIFGAGIVHGEYNIEMYRFPDGRLFIIEINARAGGFGGPDIMQKHNGIDYRKLTVTTAIGDNTYFDEVFRKSIQNRLEKKFVCRQPVMPNKSGIYMDVYISPEIMPYVTNVEQVASAGTFVDMRNVNACDVFCYVDLEFDTRERQLSFVYNIEDYIYPLYKD